MTEKGFINCWALSGEFFDQQSFHGWTITFNPEIPMQTSWNAKFNYLEALFVEIGLSCERSLSI